MTTRYSSRSIDHAARRRALAHCNTYLYLRPMPAPSLWRRIGRFGIEFLARGGWLLVALALWVPIIMFLRWIF